MQRRINKFLLPENFVAFVLQSPDFARHPVAVDIGSLQFGVAIALPIVTTRDGTGIKVGVFEQWRCDRDRRLLFGLHALRTLHDTPAMVASFLDSVNHLSHFPTHVGRQQITTDRIESNLPWIAKSKGPDFFAHICLADEWIVGWNAIKLVGPRIGHIDINPHDRRLQVAQVLTGVFGIRRIRTLAIANAEVQQAIGTKLHRSALVSFAAPSG